MRLPIDQPHKWYNAQGFGVKTSYGYHEGDDYNLKTGGNSDLGQPIFAIADGVVTSVHSHTTKPTFGNHVHIKHDGPWGTVWCHFAHCQKILVKEGDQVKEGQPIAFLGNSGTDSAHLHWAMKLQPTGIDGIAKTKEDLAKWTNPTEFVEKWKTLPTPQPTMPEKKYTEEEMTKVRLERDANWTRSEDYRNKHEELVRWLVDQLKPSGVLPPLTDEPYAKKLVEELVKSESDLQRKLTQEEKKWALERSDLQSEKESLEKRAESLETKLQEAQAMIADLQNETSFLKEEIKAFNEKKKQLDSFQVFIDLVRSFFKKGKK